MRAPGLWYNQRPVRDPRLDRLGELIAGYSLDLQPGEIVRIEGDEVAEDLLMRSTVPRSAAERMRTSRLASSGSAS